MLYHSTHRRTVEETQVFDAGICHGSAGVAHIYNRMWHYTKDPVFKEATDFWIQKTLDFAVHEDGVAGYKKYNPTTKAYENDYGLLEGRSGTQDLMYGQEVTRVKVGYELLSPKK